MKILFSSCHSVLEFQEMSILTELDVKANAGLDIEVFSMGAYSNPTQNADYLRSVIPRGIFYPELYAVAMQCSNDLIHEELIEWADVWLCMHNSSVPGQLDRQPWLAHNFYQFKKKKKRVIFRSIGQSTPEIEAELKKYRANGMQILRYSPLEERIPNYAGHDGWTGEKKQVITIAQSFKKRGDHLGYSIFEKATFDFNSKVFGTENEDLGEVNGGRPGYGELKKQLRESRVFFYTGTKPAPYTMSFVEAMLTGIPIVAIGSKLRGDDEPPYRWPSYEIPEIISNGVNGYCSDNIEELRSYIKLLMEDDEVAKRIGEAGRQTAIKLFGRKERMNEWRDFLSKG